MIDKELLDILVCPGCKKPVALEAADPGDSTQGWLICSGCGLRYPIRNNIPIMLLEEALPAKEAGA
jgi:uncharacterized protein YbaR (Trm112 family)